MNDIADRARSVLNDLDNNDLTIVSTGDIEIIAMKIDRWDAMALLRSYGAAYFATQRGVSKLAKESAFKDLRLRLEFLTK